ncbi:MAG: hypothetical protein LBK55_10195 [Azoarcus sp.]|jgi:hypothetical protein|nr:hypothetical protein [Azoarcus sp.]
MEAKVLPAAAGWQWWKSAFELLLRAPKPLMLSSILFFLGFYGVWLIVALVSSALASFAGIIGILIGILAALAIVIFMPSLFLGLLSIFRSVDRGEKPSLAIFLQPARERLLPLGMMGLLIIVFSWIAQGLAAYATMGAHVNELAMSLSGDPFALLGNIRLFLLFSLLISAVVMAAGWYSAFLVGWHDSSIINALRESFMTTMKNWAPFLISVLVYIGGVIVFCIAFGLLTTILGFILPHWLLVIVGIIASIGFAASMSALLFGFWYYTYKTVFEEQEAATE